ncbi:MAG: 1-(5-phosphoribosyl)-5-[(5-phosphoribosylamino)methylideneamino]imidazole-4-carboxamide isomerase [Clostridia bacterium]|nr:1-(5-phosphoribosyl)-5-[(5-phosphoribosylamino)methylideneamino]imidazole-4-carboxamide isomerase [Clostridia bacterium]
MIIYPAIDLYDGACIRLEKGDFSEKKVYDADPVKRAQSFVAQGAQQLHLVDLNGAETASSGNFEVIEQIVKAVDIPVQVGGGIRSISAVKRYMDIGVDRVIVGTKAIEDPNFLRSLLEIYGDRIVVSVDGKDGYVAINGWKDLSDVDMVTFIGTLVDMGVKRILCTDINRDGLLQGSNVALYKIIQDKYQVELIASGGVSSLEEIATLKSYGVYGAIIGKALYENKVSLKEAISC